MRRIGADSAQGPDQWSDLPGGTGFRLFGVPTQGRDDFGNTVGPFGVDHNDRRRPLRDPGRIDAHDVTEEEQ